MNHVFWKRLLVVGLLVAAALFLTGCTPKGEALENDAQSDSEASRKGEEEETDERVPVEVSALERGSIEAVLRFSTNLEAERAIGVFSEASRQVVELLVEEGHYVKKGQVLLRLKDDAQRSAVAKTESQLRKAEKEYQRQKRLFEDDLIPEQKFTDSTYEVEQLEIAVADAKRELSYTELRAPISGTITQRMVNLGDTITVNQKLFDMVDFNSIVARVFVPEKDMARVRVGQPARIIAESLGGAERVGKVDRIAPVVDSQSGTIKTTVSVPRNKILRPGMFVEVELVTAVHSEALLVPKRAIIFDNDQAFVFRIVDGTNDDGEAIKVAERLLVEPLLEDRAFVEPPEGTVLRMGDDIVVAGQAGLKDGAPVRLLAMAGEAGAGEAGAGEATGDAENVGEATAEAREAV